MSVKRMIRVNELLKQEVATAIYRVMNDTGFDFSAVSVTAVHTGSDLRTAHVMVSIRDHKQDRRRLLGQLRHHRVDIQKIVIENVILKYTPVLSFEIDESIEKGDRVLQIINQLEIPPDESAPPKEEPS
jgi:ribosome-binding factor A